MKLVEKQTGWSCAHVRITAGVLLDSASCSFGCIMQPIIVRYWTD